jgi:hypothetical protein
VFNSIIYFLKKEPRKCLKKADDNKDKSRNKKKKEKQWNKSANKLKGTFFEKTSSKSKQQRDKEQGAGGSHLQP